MVLPQACPTGDELFLPITLNWSSSHITVLGSRLANDGKESWEKGIHSLDVFLASWSARSLSYHGRVLIANTLGFSLFWYLSSYSWLPPYVLKTINSRVFTFVWQKKHKWLARSSVVQRCSQGGLGLVYMQQEIQSLHVLWLRRLIQHEYLPWAFFFRRYLTIAFAGCSLHQILLLSSASKSALDDLQSFYRSVVASWFALLQQLQNGKIVIGFPGASFCALRSVTASFVDSLLRTPQRTQHRCMEKYQSMGLQVDRNHVWRSLALWRFISPV